ADGIDPDLLIMAATPIPRTLSMTLYGDLDVSIIDEMPPGRAPVITRHLARAQESAAWDLIRDHVAKGRQAFVVCPLVEDSEKVEAASATAEHARLSAILSDLRVGLIHGQMRPADKEGVMSAFRAGEIDVLVSTTVIEVGIDVPNATVMVIVDRVSSLPAAPARMLGGDSPRSAPGPTASSSPTLTWPSGARERCSARASRGSATFASPTCWRTSRCWSPPGAMRSGSSRPTPSSPVSLPWPTRSVRCSAISSSGSSSADADHLGPGAGEEAVGPRHTGDTARHRPGSRGDLLVVG